MDDKLLKKLRANADRAVDIVEAALKDTKAQIDGGTMRDPAKASQNAAITLGILVDKLHMLEDRPDMPAHHIDPRIAANRLAQRLGIPIERPEPAPTPPQLAPGRRPQPLLEPGKPLTVDLEAIAKDLDDLTHDAKQRRNGQWLRIPGTTAHQDDSAADLVHKLTQSIP